MDCCLLACQNVKPAVCSTFTVIAGVLLGPEIAFSPYRHKRKETQQPRALSAEERTEVREVLNSAEYHDQPPAQIYFYLLEQGIYLCSVNTIHRLMREDGLNGERRQQRPASPQPIPRQQATALF